MRAVSHADEEPHTPCRTQCESQCKIILEMVDADLLEVPTKSFSDTSHYTKSTVRPLAHVAVAAASALTASAVVCLLNLPCCPILRAGWTHGPRLGRRQHAYRSPGLLGAS
jgi:hypothetical protein